VSISYSWVHVARSLPSLGDGVMSQHDAVANVCFYLSAETISIKCTDEELGASFVFGLV
jgi:hypothetical protein